MTFCTIGALQLVFVALGMIMKTKIVALGMIMKTKIVALVFSQKSDRRIGRYKFKARIVATRGEHNPNAKLTQKQVEEIRARRNNGERVGDLAREYGIGRAHTSDILHHHYWKKET